MAESGIPGFEYLEEIRQHEAAEQDLAQAADLRARRANADPGSVDPPYVTTFENFASMTHQEMWQAVDSMDPAGLFAMAATWTVLGTQLTTEFPLLRTGLAIAMDSWGGRSREAAASSAAGYAEEGSQLGDLFVGIGARFTEMANTVSALRVAMPPAQAPLPPPLLGLVDPAELFAYEAEAEERRQRAIAAMNSIYAPTYRPGTGVGENVPAFFAPSDPAPGFTDGTASSGIPTSTAITNSSSSSPTESSTGDSTRLPDESSTTETAPTDPDRAAGVPADQPVDSSNSHPARQVSSTTADDAVRPTSAAPTERFTSNQLGSPNFAPPHNQTPADSARLTSDQRAMPSPLVAQSPATATTTSPAARPSATRPMSGMLPGAAAGRRRDDETEHTTPDYLITQENGNQLFGKLPKTAPPVLGVWN